jgi:acyl-CoA dehydrogenase family member 9
MPEPTGTHQFVRALFEGRLETEGILPFPHPDPEAKETAESVVSMLDDWAEATIDAAAIDRARELPPEIKEGLIELGMTGLTIDEEYGGAGCGQYAYARMMETLTRHCTSSVTILGAHLGIGIKALQLFGTPEQKARWLPQLASGELIAAFALTEPGAGSDPASLRTVADRLSDGSWKLNGTKMWITNGGIANYFTVFARTPHPDLPDAELLERPISAFAVLREMPGVSSGPPEHKMGQCGSSTTDVILENVVLPADHLLGPEGEGFKVAMHVLNSGRHGIASGSMGQAKLARNLARAHAIERVQFGRPIASFGMVQEMLAAMEADIYTMEAGCWLTSGLADRGEHDFMLESACCKLFATERLWQIVNDALQIAGGIGFTKEYAFERIVRDARVNTIFEGTNEVLRMMVGAQGLRALVKGEAVEPGGPEAYGGVHPDFGAEAKAFEELVPLLGERARVAVKRHGKAVRGAQFVLRRLTDMAIALFSLAAVLSRITSSLATSEVDQQEIAVARLACKRLEGDFRDAHSEDLAAHDELVTAVAKGMTGI